MYDGRGVKWERRDIKLCKMQKHKKCREIGNMQFTYTYGHSYKHSYLLEQLRIRGIRLLLAPPLSPATSLPPHGPVARQAPPSVGFSRQAYWSGLPISSPGDLPDPGTEPTAPC